MVGVYLIFITFKFSKLLEISSRFKADDKHFINGIDSNDKFSEPSVILIYKEIFYRKLGVMGNITSERSRKGEIPLLERMADEACRLGSKAWKEVENYNVDDVNESFSFQTEPEVCPSSMSRTREDLANGDHIMFLPCGLTTGSSITVVGIPYYAHKEDAPQFAKFTNNDRYVMVSQFALQFQGLKSLEGEADIFYLNNRLMRDNFSHELIIEHNTYYKKQWGKAKSCVGLASADDEDMLIDGQRRCEKWMRNDAADPKVSKMTSSFNQFIVHKKEVEVTWPIPFAEGKMFILIVRAGTEGYHISVGGRHVSSFPYRTGFNLGDITSLTIKGNVNVHSIFATSLPISYPGFSSLRVLEMSEEWKAQPLKKRPVKLFIGVVSTTNHFSERMSIRKTWMQYPDVKSSEVLVRFFVALSERKEVNVFLMKEASNFGDIVILPYIDRYELVVLKTIAVCKYGTQNVTAAYIMKCDDDAFIKLDTLLRWIKAIPPQIPLYMGKLNYLIKAVREGKWGVTYEEWPEEVFPPFANGPAYIISGDIARFVAHQHNNRSLRLFRLEDVSMGIWVQQFNSSQRVKYSHNWKFCQYGCKRGCFTAHYQSPRQMLCLWDNLVKDHIVCCNFK